MKNGGSDKNFSDRAMALLDKIVQDNAELASRFSNLEQSFSELENKVESLKEQKSQSSDKADKEEKESSEQVPSQPKKDPPIRVLIGEKIERFLSKSYTKNLTLNEAANQSIDSSVPQFVIQQTKENQVDVSEPKRFGTESSVSDESNDHPFKIASKQNPDDENQYIVTVAAGTINSLLPTGIFSGGELAQTAIGSDTLSYVTLTANSDGEQITTATVSVESAAPQTQTPVIFGLPSTAKFLLGLVYNDSVFQVQFTNFAVTGKQQFITSKTNASVGELPYNIHYVWG